MPQKTKRKPAALKQQASSRAGPAASNQSASTKPSLIIAIDFGTTFSGVAWHNIFSNKTHLNSNWPNQEKSSNKVPTVLRYNSKGGSCKWGYVKKPTNHLEWFKLLLNEGDYTTSAELLHRIETQGLKDYPGATSTNLANLRTTIMAIPGGKKPVDLAADFLRLLYEYTLESIGKRLHLFTEKLEEGEVEIKCCLTVPAVWDDKAKDLTKQAAIAAGMPENQIYMISEPEAAAVHCLTELNDTKGNLDIGNVYVIVDCGGGTVDLIPYEVTSTAPLRVKECTIGTGGLCGSTFINRRFEDLVIRRIGQEAYDNMEDHDHYVMRKDFDTEIKPKFLPDEDDDGDDEGVMCALPGVPDDPEKRVRKMKIRFSTDELKEIFEPTFTDIAALVQKQVDEAQAATKRNVDGIIMVGGFGSSQYLENWLTANVRNKDGNAIRVIKPKEPAVAIVLGAIKHAVHKHHSGTTSSSEWGIVESRKARYNYGMVTASAEAFRLHDHPQHKLVMDPFLGIPMCVGRMKWLITKGATIVQGVGVNSQFRRRCPIVDSEEEQKKLLIFKEEIYVSAEDAAPADVGHPSVHRLLKYTTNLNDVPRKFFTKQPSIADLEYWVIPASVQIKLESADLTFTSLVEGEVYGEGKKEYHHEEPIEDGNRRQATARLPGWTYSGSRTTVCALPKPEDDQGSEHSVGVEESELEQPALVMAPTTTLVRPL